MKYDFDHWNKTEMTQEEALAWFESEFEVTDGKRCRPTCPQCQAEEWAIKALSVRWHKFPKEKPAGRWERYLICKLPPGSNSSPWIDIAYWGKSEQCEWEDSSLKRKKGYWIGSDSEWGDYAIDNVYAWMPLPEPMEIPKEKKNEKD